MMQSVLARLRALKDKAFYPTPTHEREVGIPKAEIARYLSAAPVIVEAGGHIGSDTVEMSRHWPQGTVHVFEPVPALFAKLTRRTQALPNVRRYALALGDCVGTVNLNISAGASDASSSVLQPKQHLADHPAVTFDQTTDVAMTTLDAWAQGNHIAQVDFLWLDMQGYELAAMQAAPNTLRTVQAVHTEAFTNAQYQGAPLYPEVKAWMAAQGFRAAHEYFPWKTVGNVLFVRDAT
jgi:FkbM family methyltransferase